MMNRHAYIFAAPDHLAAPDLIFWLMRHGFSEPTMHCINEPRDICIAMNAGIIESYAARNEMMVFCDNDMHPDQETDVLFYENRFQIQCVKYPVECNETWENPNAFHTGIWRASAQTILRIVKSCESFGDSPFMWQTAKCGAVLAGCQCSNMQKIASRVGLSIGHVGRAMHFPRGVKSTIPRIVTYGSEIDPRMICRRPEDLL